MAKRILITGSTDGIGLEAAKILAGQGHELILQGRNATKIAAVKAAHSTVAKAESFCCDLSDLTATDSMARDIVKSYASLDVLINNAGVFKSPSSKAANGMDIRFVVNTLSPYLLAKSLLPIIPKTGRIINVSSAAQMPVNMGMMRGQVPISASMAYAQSKLALTMWSRDMARNLPDGPAVIAVNPGSLLGTKMVKEAYGTEGKDIGIGSDILTRLALDAEFTDASGLYYDNDRGRLGPPHSDALDEQKTSEVVGFIQALLLPFKMTRCSRFE